MHPNIWPPFTQTFGAPAPLPVARASGYELHTGDGLRIADLVSSWWVITHGHCHPAISGAIARQAAILDQVIFAGYTHQPAEQLAQLLISHLSEPLKRCFFSDNGSTAVEVALKMALQYHANAGASKRTRLAGLRGGYHGDTFGAMAAGKSSGFYAPFEDRLTPVDFLPVATTTLEDECHDGFTAAEQEALEAADDYLQQHGEELAAFIAEPLVQGAGGMRMHRPVFLRALCEKIRRCGALIIFDEVMTGFGRTGSLFALEQVGVVPDMLCLSKGLTGGSLPLALTVTSEKVYAAFQGRDFSRAFAHGHSFTANPVSCAAAAASLGLFRQENTFQRIASIHKAHRQGLASLPEEVAVNKRLCGVIAAFNMPGSEEGYGAAAGLRLRALALKNGWLLRPLGGTVYLLPPYCTPPAVLHAVYDGLPSLIKRAATDG